MPKALSVELRTRVLAAVAEGIGAEAADLVSSSIGEGAAEEGTESTTSVFWSGGDAAKAAAENGGTTLEMTAEGQAIEAITRGVDWLTEAHPLGSTRRATSPNQHRMRCTSSKVH